MKEILLPCGNTFIVSDQDYDFVKDKAWWRNKKTGYISRSFGTRVTKKSVYIHRELMGFPENMTIDHINGNKSDNRRENLRIVTFHQNQFSKKRKKRSSKYLGVSITSNKKWLAQGVCNKTSKVVNLSRYESEEEAGLAVDCFIIKHHGDLSKTNFLEPKSESLTDDLKKRFYSILKKCC